MVRAPFFEGLVTLKGYRMVRHPGGGLHYYQTNQPDGKRFCFSKKAKSKIAVVAENSRRRRLS